jgi:hypothetical protein
MKFFTFWTGSSLSLYELSSLKSFSLQGFDVTLYTYDTCSESYPFKVENAEKILSQSEMKAFTRISAFANFFRYVALQNIESGSIWFDLDVLCLRRHWPEAPFLMGFERKNFVNNAVLKIPQQSPILRELINHASKGDGERFGETGPILLTRLSKKYRSHFEPQPRNSYYPIGPWEINYLIDPKFYEHMHVITQDSYAIHLYNELLVRAAIPKNLMPPRGSFLFEKFLEIDSTNAKIDCLSETWLRGWRRNFSERRMANRVGNLAGPFKYVFKQVLGIENRGKSI